MTPDLDALERLASAAEPQWGRIWSNPNGCKCEYHLYIAAVGPETVRTLIRWARLGQAGINVERLTDAMLRVLPTAPRVLMRQDAAAIAAEYAKLAEPR